MTNEPKIEVLEKASSGMYGTVYKGRQADLDRDVAVKIIKPEWRNAADELDHAKRLARVKSHKNFAMVYFVGPVSIDGFDSPPTAIVMEWVDGQVLADRLKGGRFTGEEITRICHGVLDGLEHIHACGISHGDLHAGNVVLEVDGTPRIIDIDASKESSLSRMSTITREGSVATDIDSC